MPGPAPHYQPKFSPSEIEQARAVVRKRTAPHAQVQRAQLALLLAADPGLCSTSAAARVGLSDRSVRTWRKRWVEHGFSLKDRPRSGRPPKFPPPTTRRDQGRRLRTSRAA